MNMQRHAKTCRDHDFCHLRMPNENNKILKYNPGGKSLKVPFIIYANLECLLEKINTCQNNNNKSYTEKKAKHEPSGYSLVTCSSFDKSKTKHKYYRGKDCMEKFCKNLRDQEMKIKSLMKNKKIIIYATKDFVQMKIRIVNKVRDHCHYSGK